MSARSRTRKGFTLVEILIVVVILGILAAIVIPQFSTASDAARASSASSMLQTIRSQLELYQTQHKATYPTVAQMWGNLTGESDADGVVADGNPFGPYLQKAPVNPFMGVTTVKAVADADTGWEYDEATGEIKMVLPATANPTELGLAVEDYVQLQ